MKILMALLVISFSTHAQVLSRGEEVLFESSDDLTSQPLEEKTPSSPSKERKIVPKSGNLPSVYYSRPIIRLAQTSIDVQSSDQSALKSLKSLQPGLTLKAFINHSIIAFPDEKAPVIARVTEGRFQGALVVGFAELEGNSKRILIKFNKVTFKNFTYGIEGAGLNDAGQLGLKGEYHSQELKYFSGDFISSMTAAYFESQVPKYRTLLGEVEDTSVNSALKKGLSAGAMSSAERFKEKLKKIPEFSELEGPINIGIVIITN